MAETAEQLFRAFPDRERVILELALQGLTALEVSTRVDCSERKVFRVLQRARKELERLRAGEAVDAA